jgi:ribosomal protein S27AE
MRADENRFLVTKVYRQFKKLYPDGTTFEDIIGSFKNFDLKLSITDQDLVITSNEDAFDEIAKTIPYLRKICHTPRSFIKSIEEKIQIDQVKRINKKAISKLSNNSNDWYARTFTMVKPKSVIADINEETLDIYENRLIRTLIDLISNRLIARESYLNRLLSEKKDSDIERTLMIEFKKNIQQDSLLYKLNAEKYSRVLTESDIYEMLAKVNDVQKSISILKQSELYRSLRRKSKVKSPILVTNILMFENNYKHAYKLWRELEKVIESQSIHYVDQEEAHISDFYCIYFTLNVLAALYDLGFSRSNNAVIKLEDYKLKINSREDTLVLYKKMWNKELIVSLYYDINNTLFCELKVENSLRKLTFDYDFTDFEEMSTIQIREFLSKCLKSFDKYSRTTKHFERTNSNYQVISLDINYFYKERDLDDHTIRKLYSIGDFFEKQDIIWNDYKRGVGIITPLDIQGNITRLKRIFNYHIYKVLNVGLSLTKCPICGNNEIRKANETDYTCGKCSHMISTTYHDKCDPKHEKPILWIKYSNNKYLSKPEVINAVHDESFIKRARRAEIIMGEYAITSSYIIEENAELKLKTVCPNCGEVLGQ